MQVIVRVLNTIAWVAFTSAVLNAGNSVEWSLESVYARPLVPALR